MFARGLLLMVCACTSGMYETTVVEQGACTTLEGRTFVSADGQLVFDIDSARASQVSWVANGVSQSGQVTCSGSTITAVMGARTVRATLDPVSSSGLRLQWAGQTYVAQ